MDNLGYSFDPSAGLTTMPGSGATPRNQSPEPPSAVSFKSLALPQRTVPNQGLAPYGLLNAGGAAGTGMLGPRLLQLLMQAFAPQNTETYTLGLSQPSGGTPTQPTSTGPSVTGAGWPWSPTETVPEVPRLDVQSLLPHIIAGGGASEVPGGFTFGQAGREGDGTGSRLTLEDLLGRTPGIPGNNAIPMAGSSPGLGQFGGGVFNG